MRTRVKICGITCIEDARFAVEAGADALGFVFARSPRRVTAGQAAAIIRELPPLVSTVGVFVSTPAEEVAETAHAAGLSAVQLHGDETPDAIRALRLLTGVRVIKAIRVRGEEVLAQIAAYRDCCDAVLLDAYVQGAAGGTGRTFDWHLAHRARQVGLPLFLAGGLTPDNVHDAVLRVDPYAVDVSSGVEAAPGRKDPQRVQDFMDALWRADLLRAPIPEVPDVEM